jgi:glycosyltransferase involved in cell wall biosynthesis
MPTLSICIPTYNRGQVLKRLLSSLAQEDLSSVELCISSNGSTDNTKEIVNTFSQQHPGLVTFHEYPKNTGADQNILKVMTMGKGTYIWLLADDDNVTKGAIRKLVTFLSSTNYTSIIVKREVYTITNKKKNMYSTTFSKDAPRITPVPREQIIAGTGPDNYALSSLIIKTAALKPILKEKAFIKKGIGTNYMHRFLHSLIFLENQKAKNIVLNELILSSEQPKFQRRIEDEFNLQVKKSRVNPLLRTHPAYKKSPIVLKGTTLPWKDATHFCSALLAMKAFNVLKYGAYTETLGLFYNKAGFLKGTLLSATFIITSIIPSIILREAFHAFVKIKYKKNAKAAWHKITTMHDNEGGNERRFYDPI